MTAALIALSIALAAEGNPETMPALTATQNERSELIRKTFDEVRVHTLYLLDDLYAEAMVFEDPLGRIEGLDGFKVYMEAMYQYVQEISWAYTDEVIQGDTHVLYWTMTLKTKGLNKGKPFSVDGTSHMKFGEGGKVVYHRDYFDMGAYVYERVPVVKWFVNKVKKRLHMAVAEAREKIEAERKSSTP